MQTGEGLESTFGVIPFTENSLILFAYNFHIHLKSYLEQVFLYNISYITWSFF